MREVRYCEVAHFHFYPAHIFAFFFHYDVKKIEKDLHSTEICRKFASQKPGGALIMQEYASIAQSVRASDC